MQYSATAGSAVVVQTTSVAAVPAVWSCLEQKLVRGKSAQIPGAVAMVTVCLNILQVMLLVVTNVCKFLLLVFVVL